MTSVIFSVNLIMKMAMHYINYCYSYITNYWAVNYQPRLLFTNIVILMMLSGAAIWVIYTFCIFVKRHANNMYKSRSSDCGCYDSDNDYENDLDRDEAYDKMCDAFDEMMDNYEDMKEKYESEVRYRESLTSRLDSANEQMVCQQCVNNQCVNEDTRTLHDTLGKQRHIIELFREINNFDSEYNIIRHILNDFHTTLQTHMTSRQLRDATTKHDIETVNGNIYSSKKILAAGVIMTILRKYKVEDPECLLVEYFKKPKHKLVSEVIAYLDNNSNMLNEYLAWTLGEINNLEQEQEQ